MSKIIEGAKFLKKGDFSEKISRGDDGNAKNRPFYRNFRRYWGGGGQNPILPPLTRHWGAFPPLPPQKAASGGGGVSVPPTQIFNVRPRELYFMLRHIYGVFSID